MRQRTVRLTDAQRAAIEPHNDMWIAALVLEHNLVLHARDAHFDCLPLLPRSEASPQGVRLRNPRSGRGRAT